ncbi:MAG: response regulator [Thermodesulfobacteriota bacterium]
MRTRELDNAAALNAILAAVGDPLLVLDEDGLILAANAPALARLGPGAERPGASAFALLPEPASRDLARAMRQAIATGRPAQAAIENESGPAECTAAVLPLPPDGPALVAVHIIVHSESTRLAEDLRREQQRQIFIMEALPGFAFLVAQDDSIRYANLTFRRLFGRVKDRKCHDIFRCGDGSSLCPAPAAFSATEAQQWEWTDHAERTFQVFAHPMSDTDGSRLLLIMGLDITARKLAEDALRRTHAELEQRVAERTADLKQANLSLTAQIEERRKAERKLETARRRAESATQAKSRFLANMSHEIRTPLNAVLGMAELARRTPNDAERARYLDMLRQAGEALLTVIGDILDYSKIEARKLTLERIDFDLLNLLVTVEEINQPAARSKSLDFRFSAAPGIPRALKGDPARLMQILNNLLANAVKFTSQGHVSLAVAETHVPDHRPEAAILSAPGLHWISFTVGDTGIGIPEESQETVFQSFEQADGSVSRRYGGAGLGLAICRELAGLMGGYITLESVPDRGSAFTLTLPFKAGDQQALSRQEQVDVCAAGPMPPLAVLLAEDAPLNRELAAALLNEMGHRTLCAASGREVLDILRREAVDLVLMDVQMPEMDGITATRAIRESTDLAVAPDVPIVALTAHAQKSDRERLLKAGMDAYVAKPFRLADLKRAMADALAKAGRPCPGPEPEADRALAAVLDTASALSRMEGNAKLLARLQELFSRDTPSDLEGLRTAVAARDLEKARRLAHLIKGTAATVGAVRASDAARRAEDALAGSRLDALPSLLEQLELEIRAACAAMAAPTTPQNATANRGGDTP